MTKWDYAQLTLWYATFVIWWWFTGWIYGFIGHIATNYVFLFLLDKVFGYVVIDAKLEMEVKSLAPRLQSTNVMGMVFEDRITIEDFRTKLIRRMMRMPTLSSKILIFLGRIMW